jgi:hypothetical protein
MLADYDEKRLGKFHLLLSAMAPMIVEMLVMVAVTQLYDYPTFSIMILINAVSFDLAYFMSKMPLKDSNYV